MLQIETASLGIPQQQEKEVVEKLFSMGINLDALHNALMSAFLEREKLSDLHPRTSEGHRPWEELIRHLREQLRPNGWTPLNEGGLDLTVNPDNDLVIQVCTGDKNTGLKQFTPSSKNPRKAGSIRAVKDNQLSINFDCDQALEPNADSSRATWFLLFFIDRTEIRAELSFPLNISGDRFDEWGERIILPALKTSKALEVESRELVEPIKEDFVKRKR